MLSRLSTSVAVDALLLTDASEAVRKLYRILSTANLFWLHARQDLLLFVPGSHLGAQAATRVEL
jgi:hypothetical protein